MQENIATGAEKREHWKGGVAEVEIREQKRIDRMGKKCHGS